MLVFASRAATRPGGPIAQRISYREMLFHVQQWVPAALRYVKQIDAAVTERSGRRVPARSARAKGMAYRPGCHSG